jgi:hypothetical protein
MMEKTLRYSQAKKLREFIASRPALQVILKVVLCSEMEG